MFTPGKTKDYEQLVQDEAAKTMMGKPPIIGPVELRLNLVCSVPVSWSKAKRVQALAGEIVPTKKPDIDNVVKAICDALNGIVWMDDVQVTDLVVRKRFGSDPHVEATITPLGLRGSS
ncbi:Endodeoxyribonuclease RusA [compost metagenome]